MIAAGPALEARLAATEERGEELESELATLKASIESEDAPSIVD